MSKKASGETVVSRGHFASIPATVRRALGIEPGDTLLWETTEDGRLSVRVRKQRKPAFDDFVPYDFGEPTHAAVEHDEVL